MTTSHCMSELGHSSNGLVMWEWGRDKYTAQEPEVWEAGVRKVLYNPRRRVTGSGSVECDGLRHWWDRSAYELSWWIASFREAAGECTKEAVKRKYRRWHRHERGSRTGRTRRSWNETEMCGSERGDEGINNIFISSRDFLPSIMEYFSVNCRKMFQRKEIDNDLAVSSHRFLITIKKITVPSLCRFILHSIYTYTQGETKK